MSRTVATTALLLLGGCLAIDSLDGSYEVGEPGTCAARWSKLLGEGAVDDQRGAGLVRVGETLFVAGSFVTSDYLGLQPLGVDSFVVPIDISAAVGTERPAVLIGGDGDQVAQAIAASATRVAVAGVYDGVCPSGGPNETGIFVAFHDQSDLTATTTRCIPRADAALAVTGLVLESDDTAIVVGSFGADAESDGFVFRVDRSDAANDELLFVAGDGEQRVDGIAQLADGYIVVGSFAGTLMVGNVSGGQAVDGTDAFVATFSGGGDPRLRSWGDEGDQQATSIAVDGNDVFIAGEIDDGALDFGAGVTVRAPEEGTDDTNGAYVVAFTHDGAGNLQDARWAVELSGDNLDVNALAVSPVAVYLGGALDGTLRVGDTVPKRGNQADMYVARVDRTTGTPSITMRCGDAEAQAIIALVAQEDDLHFVADLAGSVSIGQDRRSVGGSDILVGELETP